MSAFWTRTSDEWNIEIVHALMELAPFEVAYSYGDTDFRLLPHVGCRIA